MSLKSKTTTLGAKTITFALLATSGLANAAVVGPVTITQLRTG